MHIEMRDHHINLFICFGLSNMMISFTRTEYRNMWLSFVQNVSLMSNDFYFTAKIFTQAWSRNVLLLKAFLVKLILHAFKILQCNPIPFSQRIYLLSLNYHQKIMCGPRTWKEARRVMGLSVVLVCGGVHVCGSDPFLSISVFLYVVELYPVTEPLAIWSSSNWSPTLLWSIWPTTLVPIHHHEHSLGIKF